ncbi:hypothetical protein ACA29_19360 [Lederbergia galactosidilytica]|uniref:Uncharacterized protein n=1 Tax=Lederbergia galactosidilytica TaxID=217031 RepID=A0A0Q9XS27_9BACI|nr:hypothetical protein ACA29_19360 [Lederbergia galactosidilytica]
MKKKWFIFTILIFLTGCSESNIEWTDFIEFQGDQYLVSHHVEVSDPNFIGEPIGEIKKTLKDHVTNVKYAPKNGDAAYLKTGTKLYSVINHSYLIAVKDTNKINGYKIYAKEGYVPDIRMLEQIDPLSFKKIEVYEEVDYNQFLYKRLIEKNEELQKLITILQSNEINETVVYREDAPQAKAFTIILYSYSTSPIAEKHAIYFNGENYFDKNHRVFSKEIGEFLIETK